VIGTNRPDATATVESLLADVAAFSPLPKPDPDAVGRLLSERGVRYVTLDGWRLIDQIEVAQGQARGKPRLKFTRVDDILAAIADSASGPT
jgi:ferredoxin--NADP+ reductase